MRSKSSYGIVAVPSKGHLPDSTLGLQATSRQYTNIGQEMLTPRDSSTKKRKRNEGPQTEIEVDVSAPEPPSKKSLRRSKKGKALTWKSEKINESVDGNAEDEKEVLIEEHTQPSKRSPYGIWIGNLPWAATKADLRNFLKQHSTVLDNAITRLNMPTPNKAVQATSQQRLKPQNKGFAYVDFSTEVALHEALSLSEKLFTGRRVLIKDSQSFEGRPELAKGNGLGVGLFPGNSRSRRIFIGNLAFDTTKEDLLEHFKHCGNVEFVHIATFEDSGKCKGYAWIDFAELEGAEAAVRGWITYEQQHGDSDDEEDSSATDAIDLGSRRKAKPRKWWVNKLHGRPLRTEFAEDKAVRYRKRFGKDGNALKYGTPVVSQALKAASAPTPMTKHVCSGTPADQKALMKMEARSIKSGVFHTEAPRSNGVIVESKGKKIIFD